MHKKILVTGGAGFLGHHLCQRLLSEGHAVIALDNLWTGSAENLAGLIGHETFQFIRHDVCEPFSAQVDEIYHLACPASPTFYQADPVRTMKTAVLGTLNALELARSTNAKLLLASTSEVYGDPEVHPQTEAYRGHVNPMGPRSCYNEGKRSAETLCYDYHRQYGVRTRVARIFNTYGPGMREDDGRMVPAFIGHALAQQDLHVFGDGEQTRSFCYVSDMIDGLVKLMAAPDTLTGPVNLGNTEENSVRSVAQRILQLTQSSASIQHHVAQPDDPRKRCPDIRQALELLKWVPLVSLEEGLKRTIAARRKN